MPRSEISLIRQIRRLSGSFRAASVPLGIGDDASILRIPSGHEALVTTDFSLEGVHFRCDWHPPESVGHRCLARGLSDIAAMGGEPIAAFLSLALPADIPKNWVDRFLSGLLALAAEHRVTLAGGDTAQSPGGREAKILADIVVIGSAPTGTAVCRAGAKPGDLIYLTGVLGASAHTLEKLSANPRGKLKPANYPRHFFPEPRLAVGKYLRQRGLASAMIDLSDGLSTDLHHLCQESHVGASISASLIPRAPGASLRHALDGGEDYELLFTAAASRKVPVRIAGVPITRIGEISRGKAIQLATESKKLPLRAGGWEHFAKR